MEETADTTSTVIDILFFIINFIIILGVTGIIFRWVFTPRKDDDDKIKFPKK